MNIINQAITLLTVASICGCTAHTRLDGTYVYDADATAARLVQEELRTEEEVRRPGYFPEMQLTISGHNLTVAKGSTQFTHRVAFRWVGPDKVRVIHPDPQRVIHFQIVTNGLWVHEEAFGPERAMYRKMKEPTNASTTTNQPALRSD
jgi:hypothetical protein